MQTNPARAIRHMLSLLMLSLAGCASKSAPFSPRVPALPPEARQPQTPAWCVPTCSDGLRRDYERLLRKPIEGELPDSPARRLTDL